MSPPTEWKSSDTPLAVSTTGNGPNEVGAGSLRATATHVEEA